MIGSAQSKNDLKLAVDVDVELTESFASWLVTCPTKNYGRRQGMYIHDHAHWNLTSLCHTTRNLEGSAGEGGSFLHSLPARKLRDRRSRRIVSCASPGTPLEGVYRGFDLAQDM